MNREIQGAVSPSAIYFRPVRGGRPVSLEAVVIQALRGVVSGNFVKDVPVALGSGTFHKGIAIAVHMLGLGTASVVFDD